MSIIALIWLSIFLVEISIFTFYYLYLRNFTGSYRIRNNTPKEQEKNPIITMCIPTYNEEKNITRKLQNVAEFEYPKEKMEIVIIDDCSTDQTLELVRNFIRAHPDFKLRIVSKKNRRGKLDSINLFLSMPVKGSILCITDADVFVERRSLIAAVAEFGNVEIGAVCAIPVVQNVTKSRSAVKLEAAYRDIYRILRMGESRLYSTPILDAGLLLFKRGLVSSLHTRSGSPETAMAFEIIKKGFRVIYSENAFFCEEVPSTFVDRMQHKARRGKHIFLVFFENAKMLFNNKYRSFGMVIFPIEFFMHVISPILVTFLLATFPLLFSETMIFLSLCIMSLFLLNGKIRDLSLSFLSSQLALIWTIISLLHKREDILY